MILSSEAYVLQRLKNAVRLLIQKLHSKRSVWPVLFVSRKLYHAVLPTLYRKLFFEVDSSVGPYHANYKMLQLADKENQGLLYIEEVELSPQDELKRNPHEPADYPDAIQLLAAIPRASLKLFVLVKTRTVLLVICHQ